VAELCIEMIIKVFPFSKSGCAHPALETQVFRLMVPEDMLPIYHVRDRSNYAEARGMTDLTSDTVSKDSRAHFGKSQTLKLLGLIFRYGQLYRPEEGVSSGV